MLDLIFDGVISELALPFSGAGMTIDTVMRQIYNEGMSSYASLLASEFTANETAMKTSVDKLLALKK